MSLREKYSWRGGWAVNDGLPPFQENLVDVVFESGDICFGRETASLSWERVKHSDGILLWRPATKDTIEFPEDRIDAIGQNGGDGEHYDLVTKPSHYMIIPEKGVEAKHISKALLDRMDANSFELSSFGKSCWKEALQYLLRFDMKNGKEDVEKAIEYLGIVVEEMDDDSSN